jgi:putative transposase
LWVRSDQAVFFITICCTPKGENQLCKSATAEALFESVAFRQGRGDWWMHLLLLMPDHLHALSSFPSDKDMKVVIPQWKEFTAKKLGIEWQRDFFDHRLRHDESLHAKADYILQNPVRRGLIQRPEDWPYVWLPVRQGRTAGDVRICLSTASGQRRARRSRPTTTRTGLFSVAWLLNSV